MLVMSVMEGEMVDLSSCQTLQVDVLINDLRCGRSVPEL